MPNAMLWAVLVKELAYPIVILVFFVILLWKLPGIAKLLKSAEIGKVKVDFRDELNKAKADADIIKINSDGIETLQGADRREIIDSIILLARVDPDVAIYEIWRKVESSVIRLIQYNGLVRFVSPSNFVEWLGAIGKLRKEDVDLFKRLQSISNSIDLSKYTEDGLRVTVFQVLLYNDLAAVLMKRIEGLMNGEFLDYPVKKQDIPDIE